jgi:hypothetical protein
MAPRQKRTFWKWCRFCFRQFRITLWLLLLVLVAALVYVNQVGLPDIVKKPLLQALHEHGLDLRFSRLRFRWYRGIVADNVRFELAADPNGPQLTAREVQVRLNHQALQKLQIQIDSLLLRQGQLIWPIPQTNGPNRQLSATDIQTELRLLPNDQWALDQFSASLAGAKIQLSGIITNASAVREWKFLPSRQPAQPGEWQSRLRKFADLLDLIHFSATPELRLDVRGDARDLRSFGVRMVVLAPGAQTPWGTLRDGRFRGRLLPAASNELSRAELTLAASSAQTHWATTSNLLLVLSLVALESQTNLVDADLELSVDRVATDWANATNARFAAHWIHSLTNPVPISGSGQFRCQQATSRWANARKLQWSGHWVTPTPTAVSADIAWDWWTNLQPYQVDWQCQLTDVQAAKLDLTEIECAGSWRAPELTMTNLHATLEEGRLDAHADLNVATRVLRAALASNVDPDKLAPSLGESAPPVLAELAWDEPPALDAELSLVLPAWTNQHPDWRAEVTPTLALKGLVQVEHGGSFRGIPISAASAHFEYSNRCWHLPELRIARPEGRIEAEHREDERTQDYYWRVSSTIDPLSVRSLLQPEALRTFDLFALTTPPFVEAEIWGHSNDPAQLGFRGRVALTNFTFRGQSVSGFQSRLNYTNKLLELIDVKLQRGKERLNAEGLLVDLRTEKIYLTNGFSTADPEAVTRAIGAHVWRAIEPYRFSNIPTVRAHGIIPIRDDNLADLYLDISGGPFHWWRFNVQGIAGNVHWTGQAVTLSNVVADLYGGRLAGSAMFHLNPGQETGYQFELETTNILLQALMADLSTSTNRLEGRVNGTLVITKGNTDDWKSNYGYGDVNLRDGVIWDIPLFGIFSPVLDSISPGLGSSRANSGVCTFFITNGVIRSDDLEIRSPAMRLAYHGTVDLQQQVRARVEAELLRDMWLVGPIVSTMFWPVTKMFEYGVTGSLAEPKTKPVYLIPKILLFPFHPIRSLKGLKSEDSNSNRTNTPPASK